MSSLSEFVKHADWQNEKHVPVIEAPAQVKAGEWATVTVSVGKGIPHPNTTEHFIAWLAPIVSHISTITLLIQKSVHHSSRSPRRTSAAMTGSIPPWTVIAAPLRPCGR